MTKARRQLGTHVALLRGINVGGKHKLPMAALRELVAGLGGEDVRTLIQSGNVVFRATPARTRRMPAALSAAIEARFGFAPPVLLRSAAELRAVVVDNPFVAAGVDPATLHVGFLAEQPTAAAVAGLDPQRSPTDRFVVVGREVYLHFPLGLGQSKLGNAYFDRKLATVCTVRNWRTTNKLLALAES